MITAAKVKFKKPLGKEILGTNQIVEREEEINIFPTKNCSSTENENEFEEKVPHNYLASFP